MFLNLLEKNDIFVTDLINLINLKPLIISETKIFLDMLLEMNNYAGANFSDQDLKDEVVTMMATVCKFHHQ